MPKPLLEVRSLPEKPSRRQLLKLASALCASFVACQQAPRENQWSMLGQPVSTYGERSRFETALRQISPTAKTREAASSTTPLQDLHGMMTPSSLHFERHHSGVPTIDPREHRLMIHGLVTNPLILTVEEIKRLPSVSRILFLECSGNGGGEWAKASATSVQGSHGLTSCSEWTGVPAALLLREVGIQPDASWIIAEGADPAKLARSLPLKKVMTDALVAYAQNGEALRPEQGYPLRLIVPGFEGSTNIKWLRRIKLVDKPTMTRDETSKYTDLMPDGTARQFTFWMEAKSVITFPSAGQKLSGPGFYQIKGLAWSGHGAIRQVEVSTDAGQTWKMARLQDPVLPIAHTRFRLDWNWDGSEAVLQSRCQDETGYVQPTHAELVGVRGLNSTYHNNAIQSWKVMADGSVQNVQV